MIFAVGRELLLIGFIKFDLDRRKHVGLWKNVLLLLFNDSLECRYFLFGSLLLDDSYSFQYFLGDDYLLMVGVIFLADLFFEVAPHRVDAFHKLIRLFQDHISSIILLAVANY